MKKDIVMPILGFLIIGFGLCGLIQCNLYTTSKQMRSYTPYPPKDSQEYIRQKVHETAQALNANEYLMLATINQENPKWNPYQNVPNRHGFYSAGLYGVNMKFYDEFHTYFGLNDPYDVVDASRFFVRYMRFLKTVTGSTEAAVASWNCGYVRYLSNPGNLPLETQRHVYRISRRCYFSRGI